MNPGKYNRVVTIQQKTETGKDAHGGPVYSWSTFASAWAAVYPMKGRDLVTAMSTRGEIITRFDTRYITGVTQAMRILYDSVYYNITAVADPEGTHRELQIMTTSGVNDG